MKKKKLNKNDTSAKKRSVGKKVAKKAAKKRDPKEGTYNEIHYESGCELALLYYMEELKNRGYVSKISRSNSYLLCDSITHNYSLTGKRGASRPMTQSLRLGHSYTSDYVVKFTAKAVDKFCWILGSNSKWSKELFICNNDLEAEIEVKPDYDRRGSTAKAMNDMKWVYQKYGVFINLFKPNSWFEDTFTPNQYLFTDRGIRKTLRYKSKSLDDYIKTFK